MFLKINFSAIIFILHFNSCLKWDDNSSRKLFLQLWDVTSLWITKNRTQHEIFSFQCEPTCAAGPILHKTLEILMSYWGCLRQCWTWQLCRLKSITKSARREYWVTGGTLWESVLSSVIKAVVSLSVLTGLLCVQVPGAQRGFMELLFSV